MAAATREQLRERAAALVADRGLDPARFVVVDTEATFGGGSTPGERIPSAGLRIAGAAPDAAARWFQRREPPVVGTTRGGSFQIDLRCVLPEDEAPLAQALAAFAAED